MFGNGGKNAALGVFSLALLTIGLSAPASAGGIFESIFGGLRHAIEAPRPPADISAFADPFASRVYEPQQRGEGPSRAFCVRTSDGFYFPVQSHAGLSATESCSAFCPASKTRIYSGSNIDYAVASDGSRYADLDNAFLYRKQLVAGSTCNGRDPFGLARLDVNSDPTLRPGDVVATKTGLVAFTAATNKVAEFAPIDAYRGLSKSSREKLSDVKIMPPTPGAPQAAPATIRRVDEPGREGNRPQRSAAQLSGYFFP
jgi:Protein of unknown function (DUF2865)